MQRVGKGERRIKKHFARRKSNNRKSRLASPYKEEVIVDFEPPRGKQRRGKSL